MNYNVSFDSKWNDCINQICKDWRNYKSYNIHGRGVFCFSFLCDLCGIKISKLDPTGAWESAQLKKS